VSQGSGANKTEEATPKKIRDGRKEGQIPKSPELVMWTQVLVASVILRHMVHRGGDVLRDLTGQMGNVIAQPEIGPAMALFGEGMKAAALLFAPLAAGMVLVALAGDLAQTKGNISPKLIKPKGEKINPLKGAKRLFSPQGAWQAAKVLIKSSVLVAVAWRPLATTTGELVAASRPPIADILAVAGTTAAGVGRNVALAGLALAGADYAFQRKRIAKQLRMTKQEVKDEFRQQEGDAQVKGQIRQRQMEMSRNRMMADVADANVVVVNPTHVAVALRYDPAKGAPRVVAKGRGEVAARIRAEAEEAGVPLVRDVPLARSLHAACKVGEEIPADAFEAVARLLAFVFSLDKRAAALRGVIPSPVAITAAA
jgi:flagellar biosynthesis protein FlhB